MLHRSICSWMIAASLWAVAPCSFLAAAENWPQWRGPQGDGVSTATELPIAWSEQRGIAWRCPLPGAGASTPAIWGDAAFVTAHTADDRLVVVRIDTRTGRTLWRREVGQGTAVREAPKREKQKFHQLHNLASPSPVTDGERVVVHFGNGDLAAYDFAGEQLWKRNLQDDYGEYTIWWGHANSPVIAGSLLVSVCMQDSLADLGREPVESFLVAHDLATGREVWRTLRATAAKAEECDAYTTPLLTELFGRRQLVVMGGNQLDAYDPATGAQLWKLPGLVGGRTVTGPTIAHGMVYATQGMRGPLVAVRPQPSGEMTFRDIAWKYTQGTPDTCCPVVWDTLLFTVTDDGIARCFDALTGNLHWRERLPGQYKASPVAADGRIYFLNTAGRCTIVSASPRFDKLTENQLDDETLASPAIAGGRLYIRGQRQLYALQR